MVKKIILSGVAIGALATSAMAYNVTELSSMSATTKNSKIVAVVNNNWSDLNVSGFNQRVTTNALIFPAYFVGNGWETHLRVINTNSKNGIVAKVVFYAGKDSHEVRDFNIYLSPNDVWTGTVKVGSDGVAKITSADSSSPLEDGTMASATDPLSKSIDSPTGYVEVIAMAETNTTQSTYRSGHGDHAGLRKAYQMYAKLLRTGSKTKTGLIFKNGVIQNKAASYPYVDVNLSKLSGEDINNDGNPEYNLTPIYSTTNLLTGDVRITDTVNGKDMDLPAYKIDYNTTSHNSNYGLADLVYLEGEKANLADVEINGKDYNYTNLETDINSTSTAQTYLTFGDAAPQNMQAIITDPFKRLYVQSALDAADGTVDGKFTSTTKIKITKNTNVAYYKDAFIDANQNINYGSTSLVAQIFDNNENAMGAGQFSPATTPTIKLTSEVASTGTSLTDPNSLAYYINQAINKGYAKGFVKLTNANGTSVDIPGIVTQMMATTAAGKTITNWIVPQR